LVKSIRIDRQGSNIDLKTDLVVLAAGIRANTAFLKGTSIELGPYGAIKTSPKLQTTYSNIYAAGDCCCIKNIVTGRIDYIPTANNAAKMGRIAGENILGGNMVFNGSAGTKVDLLFGLEIARTGIGLKKAEELGYNAFKVSGSYPSHAKALPGSTTITVSLVIDYPTRRLLGAQMIGDECIAKRIDIFATALTAEMMVDDVYMVDLSYSPTTSTVWDAVNKVCGKAVLELENKRY
jgi:NADPH-dependent 2,4-dienoyl-CoA reductase/sulfur reductase-like enzyme